MNLFRLDLSTEETLIKQKSFHNQDHFDNEGERTDRIHAY